MVNLYQSNLKYNINIITLLINILLLIFIKKTALWKEDRKHILQQNIFLLINSNLLNNF